MERWREGEEEVGRTGLCGRAASGEARGTGGRPGARGLEAAGAPRSAGAGSGCGALGPGGAAVPAAAAAAAARRPRGLAERGPAVLAKGARRRARAHLYFAAGSRQPGLALAWPWRLLWGTAGSGDWPPEKQAHFSPPLPCGSPGRTLQARRREEARGLGRGKGPPGPRALTPGSPRRPERRATRASEASGSVPRLKSSPAGFLALSLDVFLCFSPLPLLKQDVISPLSLQQALSSQNSLQIEILMERGNRKTGWEKT
ncbi:spidroin-2-like [Vulpes lagopus]|uniref:spidroin-2-like n=1 Tax=Vulpes lagopus TaxID=494514 RepID=UPI001BC9C7BE|nr:spidroin-2-like [Vulpes lagopus]